MPYLRRYTETWINRHDYRIFERIMENRHNPEELSHVLLRAQISGLSPDIIRRFLDPNYKY